MRHRPRTRRVLKWAGTAASVAIVGSLLTSYWDGVCWQWGSYEPLVDLWDGAIVVMWWPDRLPDDQKTDALFGALFDLMDASLWLPKARTDGPIRFLTVPLWLPLLLVAVPTALLWWRDRRFPAGHCQHCGYNLTGNVSGRCPECGQAVTLRGDDS
jgi:hypothetical protein